jgi:protocatechuate 3,4-dioxygenase beta subunit
MTNDKTSTDAAGSILTRRRLLQQAGIAGLAVAAGGGLGVARSVAAVAAAEAAAAGAVLALTPEQEEGPFYVALEKIRKDVRLGRPGVPLHLVLKVVDTHRTPVANAACDIWQCDASGVYSDEASQSSLGETWLRGVQLTDAAGLGEFLTVYPGHYQGRTTHIHVKVHIGGKTTGGAYKGGHVSHTGQLLFDDAITTQVYNLAPYTSDTAPRVYNQQDHVYTQQGGTKVLLKLTKLGASIPDGLRGAITLVVDPTATPPLIGVGG